MGDTDDQLHSYLHTEASLKKVEVLAEMPDGTEEWVDVTEVKELVTVHPQSPAEQALVEAMITQQYLPVTFRRICWPAPDRVCLTGGCGDCNRHPFRALGKIKHLIRHSPADKRPGLWDAFNKGKDENFNSAQVWRGPWPKGVSRK